MPSTLTHAIPVIAVGLGLGKDYISKRMIATGAIIANIPDLDLIPPRLYGVPFDSIYGHRGYSHSLLFALILATVTSLFFIKSGYKKAFLFLAFCTLSHGILDSFTEGGLGVTFFWPIINHRYYAFVQPIMNINVSFHSLYATKNGLPILISEFIWVWIPFFMLYLILKFQVFSTIKQLISINKRN